MYIPKIYQKPQILFRTSIPAVQEAGPLWYFSFPFVAYFYILIIKVNIFIIRSNMSLHICNVMGYNQHAHTHISPELLDLSELYHQNNISLYEYKKVRYLLFSIMHSKIPQLISCLEPLKKTIPGLSIKPCTP